MKCALILCLCLCAVARAQSISPEEVRAKQLYNDGQKAYKSGEFASALAFFQAGLALKASASFVYNIASCHDKMGNLVEAVSAYQDYLVMNPQALDQTDVRIRIRELQALLEEESKQAAARRQTIERAKQRAEGEQMRSKLAPNLSAPAPEMEISVPPSPAVSVSKSPERPSSWFSRYRWPLTGAVLAAATFAVGTALVVSAASDYDALRQACPYDCPESRWGSIETQANAGYVLWAASGILAAADIGLTLYTYRHDHQHQPQAQALLLAPGLGSLRMSGSF